MIATTVLVYLLGAQAPSIDAQVLAVFPTINACEETIARLTKEEVRKAGVPPKAANLRCLNLSYDLPKAGEVPTAPTNAPTSSAPDVVCRERQILGKSIKCLEA